MKNPKPIKNCFGFFFSNRSLGIGYFQSLAILLNIFPKQKLQNELSCHAELVEAPHLSSQQNFK